MADEFNLVLAVSMKSFIIIGSHRLLVAAAVMVAPLIKELFDVAVKNDEHLVKLAGVIQRIIAKSSGSDEESFLLSDSEKEDLINALQEDVDDLQKVKDKAEIVKQNSQKIQEN